MAAKSLCFPTQRELHPWILVFLHQNRGVLDVSLDKIRLIQFLVDRFAISEDALKLRTANGADCRFWSHIRQARRELVAKGWVRSIVRGHWILTPAGAEAISRLW
jgi:hypothetical protein